MDPIQVYHMYLILSGQSFESKVAYREVFHSLSRIQLVWSFVFFNCMKYNSKKGHQQKLDYTFNLLLNRNPSLNGISIITFANKFAYYG